MRKAALASMALAILVSGCVHTEVNHPFDTSYARNFQAGVTTESDVRQIYGAPSSSVTNSDNGHQKWIYAYSKVTGSMFHSNVQSQGMVFIFDGSGKLLRYRLVGGDSNVH